MEKIKLYQIGNKDILDYFELALEDAWNAPYGDIKNDSGYNYKELRKEILERLDGRY